MMRSEALLQVRDLKTRFHTRQGTVHAVNGVSFSLARGEALSLVGESRCGKSATVLSLLRLLPSRQATSTAQAIRYDGQDFLSLDEEAMRRVRGAKIGMVFQDPLTSLNPVLTIGRQMTEMLEVHRGLSSAQARDKAAELLRAVGIPRPEDRLDDYPHQFSGGMCQRVMIAMALSCDPGLLVADEPTTALDVTIQAQILELVSELRASRDMAMIWITHDLRVVADLSDWVAVMYGGYIVEYARVEPLFASPQHPYTLGLLASIPQNHQAVHRGGHPRSRRARSVAPLGSTHGVSSRLRDDRASHLRGASPQSHLGHQGLYRDGREVLGEVPPRPFP